MLKHLKPRRVCTSFDRLHIAGEQRKMREAADRLPANSKACTHGQRILHVFMGITK